MNKIAKFVAPFWPALLLAFALLFGQAMCDLNLPNYMSNIVNTGIQQGGLENPSPDAISQNGLNFIEIFMSDADKTLISENYRPVSSADKNSDGKTYESLYPNMGGQKIYVRQDVDETTSQKLNDTFGNATWTFVVVMQDMAKQTGQSMGGESQELDVKNIDFQQLYAMQPMLAQLPPAVIQSAREKALDAPESMRKQSGTTIVRGFYEELGVDLGKIQTNYILNIGLIMLLISFLGGIATIAVGYLSSRISAGVARNVRRSLFKKVESFSSNEINRFSTASLITRTTNDITQVQMFVMMGIRMLCYAPIMCIGGVIMAVNKSSSMTWILGLAGAVLLTLIIIVFVIAMPKFKLIQKLVDKLNLVSRESLNGLMVIRAFGTQKHEKKRFDLANQDLTKTNLFVNRVMVFMMPAMMLLMNGVMLLVVWVGAHQIAESSMQVGDMMAFMQYAMQIIMSFLFVAMITIFAPRAAISANRIAEVLETNPSIRDPEHPKSFDPTKKGTVEFQNVSFRYQGAEEDALQNINFTARPGETTAIIGSTGSGKSTVANLILRFYDVTQGRILVDGADIREVTQKDLHDKIGYVPQKGVLLSGTVESNLRYAKKDASGDEIRESARIAQALDFIEEKPDQFESEISQGGTNVSGGQKQRLSIARALVKNPEIFIFDDSFSALDYKTDVALRKELKTHTKEKAVIIIAQRVSTIMQAEQIIVLNDGVVVGRGTHKELLNTCPQYREIASSQLSKEELA